MRNNAVIAAMIVAPVCQRQAGVAILEVGLLEAAPLALVQSEAAHHPHPGQVGLQHRGEAPQRLLVGPGPAEHVPGEVAAEPWPSWAVGWT